MNEFFLHKGDRTWPGVMASVLKIVSELSEAKSWVITIATFRKTRSVLQCRYLNGVAYRMIGEATGYERDDISEYLCGEYFGWREKRLPGKRTRQIPVRTTTTNELGRRSVLAMTPWLEYVEWVRRFASTKLGLFIPDPDPFWNEKDLRDTKPEEDDNE